MKVIHELKKKSKLSDLKSYLKILGQRIVKLLKIYIIDLYIYIIKLVNWEKLFLTEKNLRVMLRKSKWEEYVSVLEVMWGVQATFTLDEIYAHLTSFEKTLKQVDKLMH
jgi:hypothetical protein